MALNFKNGIMSPKKVIPPLRAAKSLQAPAEVVQQLVEVLVDPTPIVSEPIAEFKEVAEIPSEPEAPKKSKKKNKKL